MKTGYTNPLGNNLVQNNRKNLITLIHVGKNSLYLSDDNYRSLLTSATGKSSCTLMNNKELEAVYGALKKLGFRAKSKVDVQKEKSGFCTRAQREYIKKLWFSVSRIKSYVALNNFVRRTTKTEEMWLTARDATKVIVALKKMQKENYDKSGS